MEKEKELERTHPVQTMVRTKAQTMVRSEVKTAQARKKIKAIRTQKRKKRS